MLGAIIGDIAGSRFEWHNIKTKNFELFVPRCRPTDDSVMTLAVAQAILESGGDIEKLPELAVASMQQLGRMYPGAGYGRGFRAWLRSESPKPYGSFGNGAAMRVSPCGYAATSLEEAKTLARAVTAVSHDHPEGLKAAEATAAAIFLARSGADMGDIREYIENNYYQIDFRLDDIRPSYSFDVTCMGSVPQAFEAFFESADFEDAIRGAISIGGDSDTIAAIAGGIAGAYHGIPDALRERSLAFLDGPMLDILNAFESAYGRTKRADR